MANKEGTLFRFFILHILACSIFLTGFSYEALYCLIIMFSIRTVGISLGYHRYFSHRSFKTNRFFQFILGLLGSISGQRGPLWWAALHRHHHQYSDTREDIHSPNHLSFYEAHIGWALKKTSLDGDYSKVKDFLRFPEIVFLEKYHLLMQAISIVLLYIIGEFLFSSQGFRFVAWGFFLCTVLQCHSTLLVNSVGHLYGSQDYETGENSRNVWWLALPTFGDGWHNNHHAFPKSCRHGLKWWQIDLNYYILKILELFGIVSNLYLPKEFRKKSKSFKFSIPMPYVLFLITMSAFYLLNFSYQSPTLNENSLVLALTMIIGSLVAGSTPLGGGAVAFPVMALILNVAPLEARNFSLAIQSIGMSAAAILIVSKGFQFSLRVTLLPVIIAFMSFTFFSMNPIIANPRQIKLIFAVVILLFGIFFIRKRKILFPKINLNFKLIFAGLIGGFLTSIFGSGLDIALFLILTLTTNLDIKEITFSSVIAMALMSIFGTSFNIYHNTISEEVINYLLICAPIVIFGAPLGSIILNKLRHQLVKEIIFTLCIIQFFGAMIGLRFISPFLGVIICISTLTTCAISKSSIKSNEKFNIFNGLQRFLLFDFSNLK